MTQVEFATFRSSENAGIPRRCGRSGRGREITISKRRKFEKSESQRIEISERVEHISSIMMSSRDKQNVKRLATTRPNKIQITNSKSQQLNIAIQLICLFFLMLNNNIASATLMAPNEMRSLDDFTALESRAEDDELSKTMAGNLLLDEATDNLNAELQQQSRFQSHSLEGGNDLNGNNYTGNKTNWPADFGGQTEPSELSQVQSSFSGGNVTIDNQQPINGTNYTSGGLVEVHEPGIYLPGAEEEKSTTATMTAKKLKKRKKKKKKRKQETKLKIAQLNELSSSSQEIPQHMISYVTSRRPSGSRAPEAQQQLASPLKFIQFSRGLNNFYNLLPVNFVGQKQSSALPGERSLPLGASNQSLAAAAAYGDGASAHKVNGPFELEQLQATETRANGKSAASGDEFAKVEEENSDDSDDDRDEPLDEEDDEREPLRAAVNQTTTTSDLKITRQAHQSTPGEQHASSSTGGSISVVRQQQQHYEQHELDGANNKTKSTSGRPEVDPPKTSSGGDQVVAMKAPTQALGGNNELLVGPFKSEAEAPATITLAGVVYQKSGASSALIRTSASRGAPSLLAPPQVVQASPYDDWLAPVSMQQQQPAIYSPPPTDYQQQQQQQQASLVRFSPFSLAQTGELSLSSSNQKAATTKLMPTSSLYPPAGGQQLSLGSQLEHAQSLLGATQSLHRLPGGTTIWTIGKPASGASSQQAELSSSSQLEMSESKSHSAGDKHAPIVIVQKDVKPVKYHLLRAYLKLRRLLRPFEATYVFPGESGGSRAALDRSTAGSSLFTRNGRRRRRRRRQRLGFSSREE